MKKEKKNSICEGSIDDQHNKFYVKIYKFLVLSLMALSANTVYVCLFFTSRIVNGKKLYQFREVSSLKITLKADSGGVAGAIYLLRMGQPTRTRRVPRWWIGGGL